MIDQMKTSFTGQAQFFFLEAGERKSLAELHWLYYATKIVADMDRNNVGNFLMSQ